MRAVPLKSYPRLYSPWRAKFPQKKHYSVRNKEYQILLARTPKAERQPVCYNLCPDNPDRMVNQIRHDRKTLQRFGAVVDGVNLETYIWNKDTELQDWYDEEVIWIM